MNTLQIRTIEIGAGAPKVIVPIVGGTKEEILAQARRLKGVTLHMVEWRIDFYEDVLQTDRLLETLHALREILGDTVLLVTFRTKGEGGQMEISMAEYAALNTAIAQSGDADVLDVEVFSGDDIVHELMSTIHAAGALVVGSYHDFDGTPSQAEMVSRLRKAQDMGADIPKIAVMPHNAKDVLALLGATEEMYSTYADRPIITMSMSGTGTVSRLCGEVFGSALTFGSVGKASAPGQIPVEFLATALDIIHGAL